MKQTTTIEVHGCHANNWINGEWMDSKHHKKSFNPATGEQIGTYADAEAG
ncbi:MAG TPA: hypothetical protein VL727_14030 [Puia sp.]|nr:hypothetical protein [Puia sp.]